MSNKDMEISPDVVKLTIRGADMEISFRVPTELDTATAAGLYSQLGEALKVLGKMNVMPMKGRKRNAVTGRKQQAPWSEELMRAFYKDYQKYTHEEVMQKYGMSLAAVYTRYYNVRKKLNLPKPQKSKKRSTDEKIFKGAKK